MTLGGSGMGNDRATAGFLARQGILIAFFLFIIGFTFANPRFLDIDNIMGVVRSSAILGVMALGVTFVVISGNLDLSVGSMMSFSTIVVLDLHDKIGPALAIPAMFAMTLCLGALIGLLVGYLKLNSLIVTLGMLSAIHGLTLTYSGGKNMDIADKEGTWFDVFGQGEALGDPVPILIFLLLAACLGPCWPRRPSGARSMRWAATGLRRPSPASARAGGVHLLPALGLLRRHRRADPGEPLARARRTRWARDWSSRCWRR
jgi:ribose transport system permease protein